MCLRGNDSTIFRLLFYKQKSFVHYFGGFRHSHKMHNLFRLKKPTDSKECGIGPRVGGGRGRKYDEKKKKKKKKKKSRDRSEF